MPIGGATTQGFGMRLSIVDAFSTNLTRFGTKARMAEAQGRGLGAAITRNSVMLRELGMAATLAGGAIVAGMGLAIHVSGKFEQSMANVASVASATGEELQELSGFARQMGADTVFSATEAADAMYFLACLGPNEYIRRGDFKVEKIGTFNKGKVISSNGLPQKVLKHTKRPCIEGKIYKIKPRMMRPFKLTGNHPLLAIKTKKCLPYMENNNEVSRLCKPNCSKQDKCTRFYYHIQ